MLTSARNQFAGKVAQITTGAVNDEIQIELAGGDHLVSIVTHESVENLRPRDRHGRRRAGQGVVGDRRDRRRARRCKLSARNHLVGQDQPTRSKAR